ncbi:aminotransferase class III-fold pyridoxal phosphate-dependent enzyme [Amycolatopsis sp. PS_44_ISF1]|uniref:aminotransferase class III-fold pyridoxal phosphate-dependent enzyme n=1 Tax=Amycolatopsis sp. PS_44_ISF1 TaxID=2974917 RepID=UPI0028DFCCE9|nr:aminotransferase class III-fold pyridoxal phosphate-dependent enzyme [Amycolatopsis sp. PS_44_ISF1]MDT8912752.1 aminotransferase class III-fold pyridoxal phosphate-dependent enzyme [Amycolatopsis sp. PS_44_ISF1]
MNSIEDRRYPESLKLLRRAERVIPGGVWGHNRIPSSFAPDALPWFAERAEGARMRDVDGNWYIDYICGYGAMINGYARAEVDDAVREQSARGSTLSHATQRSVELAELLVDLVDGAAWASWGANGSDATWSALVVARAHTGRPLVAAVDGAYHGSHGWNGFPTAQPGRITADTDAVRFVRWNDIPGLDELFGRDGPELAAIMVTPYHHPIPGAAELPDPAWIEALHRHCRRAGTLLVIDDVRAGFRLDLRGSHALFGFRPDLVCFSKGLGNGWPLSALVGAEALRAAAAEIFLAGTFWNSANSMAAAIANLTLLRETDGVATMRRSGLQLTEGLVKAAERVGVPLAASGPPAMPSIVVEGDEDCRWMARFATHMAASGVLIHPSHNWALSTAHDAELVEQTLAAAETAMERTQEELPR